MGSAFVAVKISVKLTFVYQDRYFCACSIYLKHSVVIVLPCLVKYIQCLFVSPLQDEIRLFSVGVCRPHVHSLSVMS